MSEGYEVNTATSKSKKGSAASSMLPKFEMPHFDLPKFEISTAFREMAEKSVSQAKDTYDRMKSVAEEATDVLEGTYATTTKGVSEYGQKVIEAARENTNAAFDFATKLIHVKSFSEVVELSTAHTRKQYESVAAQTKELAAIAQKTAVDAVEPVKESFGKVLKLS
jgi:phasin